MSVPKKLSSSPKEHFQARPGSRWKPRESARNVFVCIVDNHVTTADLLRTGAFDLVSQSLRPRDTVEVFARNNRKYWELAVIDSGIDGVRVHLRKEENWPRVTQENAA